ncbi:uncharacterized protein LOC135172724 [Diachasmimorpha longicaudata]|uniref:uncharacterized protein LOC135172724 n=1 Tax=Diachasmimorpha longicaudata TaxID=58733 RepID=UPI0030B8E843
MNPNLPPSPVRLPKCLPSSTSCFIYSVAYYYWIYNLARSLLILSKQAQYIHITSWDVSSIRYYRYIHCGMRMNTKYERNNRERYNERSRFIIQWPKRICRDVFEIEPYTLASGPQYSFHIPTAHSPSN